MKRFRMCRLLGSTPRSFRVMIRAKEVEGDIRFFADNPAVMRFGGNIEHGSGIELPDSAIIEGRDCRPLQYQS